MNKEDLILQVNKIYQALNTISVQGYANIKTLGNCMDALQKLAKDTSAYEEEIQNAIEKQIESLAKTIPDNCIVPVNPSKPKPQCVKEEVSNDGENRGKAV